MKKKEVRIKKVEPILFSEKISKWIGSNSSLYAHTLLFIMSFVLIIVGIPSDKVLLTLTTIVSLEAIYLAIFIQMTVNRNTESLEDVEEGLDDIQEDIEDIQEDVDDIQEDIDDIQESQEDLEEDIDEIEDADTKRDREINEKFKSLDAKLEIILNQIKNRNGN
jgi:septal ring factor EnvC (AmiA/AmiB activator)